VWITRFKPTQKYMYPKPKPQRGAKKKANEKRKRELAAYRKEQMELAYNRDEGGCRVCEKERAFDVHHVYGHGREAGDWQEHFSNMFSCCRKCHPLPIKFLPPKPEQMWQIELLDKINTESRRVNGA